MQNMSNGGEGGSWSCFAMNDDAQSRNLAAIALAEAMDRARAHSSGASAFEVPRAVSAASPSQRLQALRLKLEALYSAIPQDVEGIDLGHVREDRPRLYLDMIAYADLAQDGQTFRLVQDGRNGGQVLHETADETAMIARVTDYIAHRLILRERALEAGDPGVAGATHFSRGVSAATKMHVMQLEESRSHDLRGREIKEIVPAQPAPSSSVVKQEAVTKAIVSNNPVDESIRMNPAVETLMRQTAMEATGVKAKLAEVAEAVNANLEAPGKTVADAVTPAVAAAPAEATVARTASESLVRSVVAPSSSAERSGRAAYSDKVIRRPLSESSPARWWLWPTFAVLLGMACGAYLLYLYAVNFTA